MKRGGPLSRRTPLRRSSPKPKAATARRTIEDMSHAELEALLDAEVSLHVRATPALKSHGLARCITCGAWKPWKEMDCGHYIPRHRRGTRFDLRNLRPQCVECNKWREGEHWKYRQALVEELGEKEVEALELTASLWGDGRHPREWLISEIKKWRERNKPLRKSIKEDGR